jgi:hypothetical protein
LNTYQLNHFLRGKNDKYKEKKFKKILFFII